MKDWLKSKYCFHPPETAVSMLMKHGYRQISRKNKTVARIDITPQELIEFFDGRIASFATEKQQECYRNNHTPDKITLVPEPVMMLLRKRERSNA